MTRPIFDSYLMVDWSAANTPRRGRDSIWLCHLVRHGNTLLAAAPENLATRQAAHERLRELLCTDLAQQRSVLVGCDFPFGYARGLAERLGLSRPAWRAVWDEIASRLQDGPDNANNRFDVATQLNARISGRAFPFWGCPTRKAAPCLAKTHHRRHEAEGLAERRLTDMRLRRLQPGWKLLGTGSAGSQALTGIPVVDLSVHRYRPTELRRGEGLSPGEGDCGTLCRSRPIGRARPGLRWRSRSECRRPLHRRG